MRSSVKKNRETLRYITAGALIAALYTALTYICSLLGLSSGLIQLRLSEALCVLVTLTPAAVPGLWIGCLLSNLLTTANVWDMVFGSLATLLGAAGGLLLARLSEREESRNGGNNRRAAVCRFLIPVPTVAANTLVIPFVLKYAYGLGDTLWLLMVTVGIGEILSAWAGGVLLMWGIRKRIKK